VANLSTDHGSLANNVTHVDLHARRQLLRSVGADLRRHRRPGRQRRRYAGLQSGGGKRRPDRDADGGAGRRTENTPYLIAAADLLAGFSDVDGDALSVANLAADHGSLADNGNGTWTLTPDANYSGPVALSYDVIDGKGGSVPSTQGFSLAAVNSTPTGSPTAVLAAGSEDTPYLIAATDLLAGFSDADGDALSAANLAVDHGNLVDNNDGTWTFTPDANYFGPVAVTYDVVDGRGGSIAATQGFSLAAVNDAPTGTPTACCRAAQKTPPI